MPQVQPEDDPLLKARLKRSSENFDQHRMQAFDTSIKHLVDDLERLRPEGEDFVKTFVANHGVPKRHIRAHLNFEAILGPISAQMRDGRLDLETLVTLFELGKAAREEVMRFVEGGHPTDTKEVTRIAADWREMRKTDDEAYHHETLRILGKERLSKVRREGIAFRRAASALHKLLVSYDELPPEGKSPARAKIMRRAATLHARFTTEVSRKAVLIEDWGTITNPAERKLTEAEHALKVLADGEFHHTIPSFNPSVDFPAPFKFRAQDLPTWSATESVGFLARKKRPSATSKRHNARPVTKLSAVEISAGIGAKALALKSAGFVLNRIFESNAKSVDVIKRNRPTWPVHRLDLNNFDNIQQAMEPVVRSRRGKPLDLIAGGLPLKPWQGRGTDEEYQDQANLALINMVEAYDPKAFFVEIDEKLLKDGRIQLFQWMTTFFAGQRYHLDVFELPYKHYGIPQNRTGHYLVGVKQEFADRLRRPIIRHPKTPSATEIISDVAFPHRTVQESAEKKVTAKQKKYDDWASEFLDKGPTIVGDLKGAWSTTNKETWLEYRIDLDATKGDAAVRVGKLPGTSLIPLTTSMIKRWQGIPDKWEVSNGRKRKGDRITLHQQVKMLCAETPPVITLAVARSVHAALTGEYVDLDSPGALSISSSHFMHHPLDPYDVADPRQQSAALWKRGVRAMLGLDLSHLVKDDFEVSDLPDVDSDPEGVTKPVRFRPTPGKRQKPKAASKRNRLSRS
ncbi:DNA cytosine methyltransferase [Rhizobium sp. CFBP 13726]|uniref:DNA cytosine methyltransferase n=1 Tax=Rhizobium sp. CFBP 13726 TaxID=2775296 RepID=UPI00177F46FA|nr:DNA cytosine methyltransferase [Rhizobium sp. CFBP 13726]MBD8651159.1 DNA cytosine methyltransferase [Rhizobium sp. CFBP 13726]